MVQIDLVDQQPVLIQNVLNIHKALLETLQLLNIHKAPFFSHEDQNYIPVKCNNMSRNQVKGIQTNKAKKGTPTSN